MAANDPAKRAKTYRWQRETDADGKPRFVVITENGSRFDITEFKVFSD